MGAEVGIKDECNLATDSSLFFMRMDISGLLFFILKNIRSK